MVIKLDYDAHNGRRLSLREMVRRAERANLRIVQMWRRRSPGGKGWHAIVIVDPAPVTAMQVVALQLLFGSDPLREAYCYNRARLVDGSGVAPYWQNPDAWDVLYTSQKEKWQRLTDSKVLAAHRERTGRRARQPRAI